MDLTVFSIPSQITTILQMYVEHPEEWSASSTNGTCGRLIHNSGLVVVRTETAYRVEIGDSCSCYTLEKGCALGLLFAAMRKREITGGGSLYIEMPFDCTLEPMASIVFRWPLSCEQTECMPSFPGLTCKIAGGLIELQNTTRETINLLEGMPIAKII